jgi:peroxiredoxin
LWNRFSEEYAMLRSLCVLLALALVIGGGSAQGGGKFNKKIKIGAAAPNFAGLPGVDGKPHSLSEYKDKDVVVLVFTCNHCPVSSSYEGRLIDFAKKYPADKLALVAINVNTDEEDSLPNMIVRAKEKAFNFPYLYDESQKTGRALGATVTPEFFVLNKERKVVYMGAMDDAINAKNVTTNYLVPAVEAALKGAQPATAETAARGCTILYNPSTK